MGCASRGSFQGPFEVFLVAGIFIRSFLPHAKPLRANIDAGLLSEKALNKGLLSAWWPIFTEVTGT